MGEFSVHQVLEWLEHTDVLVCDRRGATREREPFNAQDDQYWATRYPTLALLPVMGLVKLSRELEVHQIQEPVFIAYSPEDSQVDPEKTIAFYHQLGSEVKHLETVEDSGDPFNHVIAGQIRSPNTTQKLTQQVLAFLEPIVTDLEASEKGEARNDPWVIPSP